MACFGEAIQNGILVSAASAGSGGSSGGGNGGVTRLNFPNINNNQNFNRHMIATSAITIEKLFFSRHGSLAGDPTLTARIYDKSESTDRTILLTPSTDLGGVLTSDNVAYEVSLVADTSVLEMDEGDTLELNVNCDSNDFVGGLGVAIPYANR